MSHHTIRSRGEKEVDAREPQILSMIIGLYFEQAHQLSDEDRNNLAELAGEWEGARGDEEQIEAIRLAVREILDNRPGRLIEMPGVNRRVDRPEGLQKWVDYVGKRVRETRKALEMTQEELADRSGLPQSHISRIENRELSPTQATLEKLATALKISLSELDPSA